MHVYCGANIDNRLLPCWARPPVFSGEQWPVDSINNQLLLCWAGSPCVLWTIIIYRSMDNWFLLCWARHSAIKWPIDIAHSNPCVHRWPCVFSLVGVGVFAGSHGRTDPRLPGDCGKSDRAGVWGWCLIQINIHTKVVFPKVIFPIHETAIKIVLFLPYCIKCYQKLRFKVPLQGYPGCE